jgi:hypothetical protein
MTGALGHHFAEAAFGRKVSGRSGQEISPNLPDRPA